MLDRKRSMPAHQSRWPDRRRTKGAPRKQEKGMHLAAIDMTVAADMDLLTPSMQVAVVEDTCWALARDYWQAEKPPWWHWKARKEWAAEGRVLDAKRERVRALARASR